MEEKNLAKQRMKNKKIIQSSNQPTKNLIEQL